MSITITPVTPAMRPVVFGLTDFESVSGGVGGWETLERPRNSAAAEWVGTPERTLTLPLIIDGIERGRFGDRQILRELAAVESWGVKHAETGQPPILQVLGSRYATSAERWVLQDITWGEFAKDDTGRVVQQELTLTLLRYLEAKLVAGPAAIARANNPQPEKPKKKRRKRKKRRK